MRPSADRIILMALPVVALVAGAYLLLIAPKRSEVADLGDRIETERAALETAEGQIAAGEAAREGFASAYSKVVSLGAAAPADGGQSTLLYDLAELGKKNGVRFQRFEVSGGADATAAPPAAPPPPPPPPEGEEGEGAEVPAATETAAATEAAAAKLPLGASVGPAGLPVIPYSFTFTEGDFFTIADFFAAIDAQVTTTKAGEPKVEGRLLTIDSFDLTADPGEGFPKLQADFNVTAYVLPEEQGLVAGATPAGPPRGELETVSAGGVR